MFGPFSPQDILLSMLVPLMVALGLALLGRWLPGKSRGEWAMALGLPAGAALGMGHALGWPQFPATASSGYLFYAAIVLTPLLLLDATLAVKPALRGTVAAAAFAGICWFILHPLQAVGAREAAAWIVGAAVVGLLVWLATDRLLARSEASAMPWVLLVAGVCGSLTAAMSDSLQIGLAGGALAAAAGALAVAGFFRRGFSIGRSVGAGFLVLYAGILTALHFLTDHFNAPAALVLFVLPLCGYLERLPRVRNWSPWKRGLLALIAAILLAAIVVVPVAIAFQKDMAAMGGE